MHKKIILIISLLITSPVDGSAQFSPAQKSLLSTVSATLGKQKRLVAGVAFGIGAVYGIYKWYTASEGIQHAPSLAVTTIDGRTVRVSLRPKIVRETRTTEIPLTGARLLDVTNIDGSVEVVGRNNPAIKIETIIQAVDAKHLDDLYMQETHTADSLTIRTRLAHQCEELGSQISYKIFVPRAMQISNIVTRNGMARIKGVAGSIKLHTSNGNVNLADIDGNVEVETSNGVVIAQNIAGSAKVSSSNGMLMLENIGNNIDAKTSNGVITLCTGPANAQISADTSNGLISLDQALGVQYTTKRKDSICGSIGDGRYKVNLSTSNGPIIIK